MANPSFFASLVQRLGVRVTSLRVRIGLTASIGIFILALVFVVTLSSAVRVGRSISQLSALHLIAESFRSVNNALLSLESSQGGYLLTGDSTFLVQYDSSMQAVERRVDSLHRAQRALPAAASSFETLDSLVRVRLVQINSTIAAYGSQGPSGAIRQMHRNQAAGTMDSLRSTLRVLNDAEEAERLDVKAASASAGRSLVLAEVVGGILALILLYFALRQISADLDAREQAESSLRQSERFLDSIIDLLPLMVFVKDAKDLRFVRFNRTAEKLVGLSRDAVLGRTDFDIFPEPLAQGFVTVDRAVLAAPDVRDIAEEVMVAPNGAVRTMHTRKVAVRDDAGAPLFLLGVSEDISERKRAEADIQRARDSAEAASRAKSDFLAKMSHELRTPLNSIIGFSQLMEEESIGPLTERQRRYVNNVLTSGRQLLELINDILDLSKVEAGRMELSLSYAPLLPLLREAMSLVEPLAVTSGLHLRLEPVAALPSVLVDIARFRQILYNLLGNAIKFTGRGGTVTLGARLTPDRARSGAATVRITVQDTGVGIQPGDLERIFREFEQVDSDAARNQKGTGLGLALARRLAELHGGRLWAESEFGQGSSFHIELPVVTESPGSGGDPVAAEAPGPSRAVPADPPLVMVVENDSGVAQLLRHHLEAGGYRTAVVPNGEDPIERARELCPDAITMDVVVPGGHGLGVLSALKGDPRTARIPVLIASVTGDRPRGLLLGAFDWLVKPVERESLVATLQRVVAGATEGYPSVLAIDDDPGALDVIRSILEGSGFRVTTTTDSAHGLHLARTLAPAAIILDLMMPGISGFEVVSALREDAVTRGTPIIVFSSRELSGADRQRLDQVLPRVLARPDRGDLLAELNGLRLGVRA